MIIFQRVRARGTGLSPYRKGVMSSSKNSIILLIVFVLFILYGTTLPYDFTTETQVLRHNIDRIRWVPLARIDGGRESMPDMVSNVLLFIPLGVLIGLVISRRKRHSSWALIFGLALLGSALLSGLVETLQLFSVSRITSVTDLLTNTLGGLTGAILLALLLRILRARRLQWNDGKSAVSPEIVLLLAYLAVLFLSAAIPFDISLDIGHLKTGLKAVRLDPFSDPTPLSKMLGNALWLAGLSFLFCLVLSRSKFFSRRSGGRLPAVLSALILAGAYTILVEILQIFIRSRVAATRDVLAGLTGAVYGALWFLLLKPSVRVSDSTPPDSSVGSRDPTGVLRLFIIHYLLFLAHGALHPYEFAHPQDLSGSIAAALVPFASYYGKTNALALFDFLGGILRFIPLGFLLQRCGLQGHVRRPRGQPGGTFRKWSAVLICLLAGTLLEGIQLFVVGRYADSSDIIAAGCGGYAGWWVWRWWVNRP